MEKWIKNNSHSIELVDHAWIGNDLYSVDQARKRLDYFKKTIKNPKNDPYGQFVRDVKNKIKLFETELLEVQSCQN